MGFSDPPGEILKSARAAAQVGDYAVALINYEHFFNHALQDQGDEHNYYGVRLSYCLDEWARLGEQYPEARQRLEAKAAETIVELQRTRRPELFHDFIAINNHLGRERTSINFFLNLHRLDRSLANTVVNYIWDSLVADSQWAVCAEHLSDPVAKYKQALETFDMSMQICIDDPSLGGADFERQIKGWYMKDVTNLCLVLKNADNGGALVQIVKAMESDMRKRVQPAMVEEIRKRAAL